MSEVQQSQQLADAFKSACMAELEAIKPGNVHIFADGHGMIVQDFIASAEATAKVIAQKDLTLGERILVSIQATQHAVACNTNLGIILLCAPLIHAALREGETDFVSKLKYVLANTTREDAQNMFAAIVLARPAGLGNSKQHDVHQPANCTLLEAMNAAAGNDLIAIQYGTDFFDVMNVGLKTLNHCSQKSLNSAWSTTMVYLTFLSQYLDTHIVRKHGMDVAKQVHAAAQMHLNALNQTSNLKLYLNTLLVWDSQLKQANINPGTSADMTVATLLLQQLVKR
jgi:triphosphoribosyl-dephospho-CoA synthase